MARLSTPPVVSSCTARDSHQNHGGDTHYVYFAKCQLQALGWRCVHVSAHERCTVGASASTSSLSLEAHPRFQTSNVRRGLKWSVTLLLPCRSQRMFCFRLLFSDRNVEILCHCIRTRKHTVAAEISTFPELYSWLQLFICMSCLMLCFCCLLSPGSCLSP